MKSACECLIQAIESKGDFVFVDKDGQLSKTTYAQLYALALNRLAIFQAIGVRRGSILIIKCGSRTDFTASLWARILGDYIALPVETDTDNTKASNRFLEEVLARIQHCPQQVVILDTEAARATAPLRTPGSLRKISP